MIVASIIAENDDDAKRDTDQAEEEGADIIEFRFDYNMDSNIEELINHTSLLTLATFRHEGERGRFSGSEELRGEKYQRSIDSGVDSYDIELNHYIKLNKRASQEIISKHDFGETIDHNRPTDPIELLDYLVEKLLKIRDDMLVMGDCIPKIYKAPEDIYDTLAMQIVMARSSRADIPMIGISGLITRIKADELGAVWTYAGLEGKPAAPDQPTIQELQKLRKRFSYS